MALASAESSLFVYCKIVDNVLSTNDIDGVMEW